MGPRYLIPAIPFLVVLAVGVVPRWRPRSSITRALAAIGAALTVALVVASAVLMLAGTAVKPEVPMGIQRPFADYLLPGLYSGQLSISTQGIDSKWPSGDDRQAWNVGQLAGLDGLISLLPLGLYIVMTGTWLVWTVRRCGSGWDSRETVKSSERP